MPSYTPNAWTTGDTVTKTKLDRLEAGAAAALASTDAPELIRDTMATALVAGTNVTITTNDGANTTTIAAAVGGGGGSGTLAAAQTIYAIDPPSGSGLSAIAANGSTDDRVNLQAMINYVTSTWGEGKIDLPGATIRCDSGLTGLGHVQLVGKGKDKTILDFSGAGTSVLAIDSVGENTSPITQLKLLGPNTGDKLTYPTNTSTGVRLAGVPARIDHVRIEKFFYGVDSTNNNSFFQTLNDVHIGYAGVGWDLNGGTSHNGGSTPSEFGEKMVFTDGSIYNSQIGVDLDQSGVGFFATDSSFDYLGVHAHIINSSARFVNCHLETGYAAVGSGTQGNWGSVNRYLFLLEYEPRVAFDTCRFEVRDPGVYSVISHSAGPATYNSGYCAFGGTNHWYGAMPNGEQRIFCSREKVSWPSGDGATKVVRSPFLSKWNAISARACMTDGDFPPAGHFFRPTAADYGTTSSGQAITLTRDLDGVSAATTWVEVTF